MQRVRKVFTLNKYYPRSIILYVGDEDMVGRVIIAIVVALSIGALAGCAGKGKGKGKGKDPEVVAPAPVYKG